LAAVDLNLVVAFDALALERNVTRAAARVGLSQPALSKALNRAGSPPHLDGPCKPACGAPDDGGLAVSRLTS
jgi:hypothetical protein